MSADDQTATFSASAVVAHYGDPEVALRAVVDLQMQSSANLVEVIVVDDCSPIPFPDVPGVVTVRRDQNGGFGAAVNSGAALARGKLLMIVNSDVRLARTFVDDFLQQAISYMPAVVGPRTTNSEGYEESTGRRFPTTGQWVIENLVLLRRFSTQGWYQRAIGRMRPTENRPLRVDWLQGSLLVIPTEAFLAVGGFDERYFLYSEEVDLQRRLGAVGIQSWLLPSVTVEHVGGASTDFSRAHGWLVRSRITYADKWGGSFMLRSAMRATALVNLGTRAAQRITGQQSAPRLGWQRDMQAARTHPWPARTEASSHNKKNADGSNAGS